MSSVVSEKPRKKDAVKVKEEIQRCEIKFNTVRKLHCYIDTIRYNYMMDMHANDEYLNQRAVALYFMDRLLLRSGQKIGKLGQSGGFESGIACFSLKVKHVRLQAPTTVHFNIAGMSAGWTIPYHKQVEVEERVFEALGTICKNKKTEQYIFDKIDMGSVNDLLQNVTNFQITSRHLRLFKACTEFQRWLIGYTDPDSSIEQKMLAYNQALVDVCETLNHKQAVREDQNETILVPSSTLGLRKKMQRKLVQIKWQCNVNSLKTNYLDPRITEAWRKKHGVPENYIYVTDDDREKYRWLVDETAADFHF